jgi:hypothetical protein
VTPGRNLQNAAASFLRATFKIGAFGFAHTGPGDQERTADNSDFSMDCLKVRVDIPALKRKRIV